uniref:O-methyltransferase dimerisation domain-containing protein n=1 Tax=Opuntia streptacantha TaxID=393608 RepID=A0A7C9DQU9_OPUST
MSEIRGGEEEAENEACLFAMSIATWAVPFHVVKAIIDLNVFEIIRRSGGAAQLSAAEIAAQLDTANPDAATVLDRMLRLLAAFSVVTSSLRSLPDGGSERVYGLAPVCKYLTKNEDGVSFAPTSFISHDRVLTQVWCGAYWRGHVCKCSSG